jgi:uncharacterized cupin superfamily protein
LYTKETNPPHFDESLASAVVAFQEKYKDEILAPWGLAHGTGFVGKATRAKLNKLYGCKVIPKAKAKPFIQVLSPNGGEKWEIGKTYEIRWRSAGIGKVYITLFNYDQQDSCRLTYESIDNTGSYYFVPGQQGSCPQSTLLGNKIKIEISADVNTTNGVEVRDESDDYFSIVSPALSAKSCDELSNDPTASYYFNLCKNAGFDRVCLNKYTSAFQGCGRSSYNDCTLYNVNADKNIWCDVTTKSITVIRPNGGEKLILGVPQTIAWKSTGIDKVAIYLLFPDGLPCRLAIDIPANLGSYTFTFQENQQCPNIPRKITSGQYKVAIWSADPSSTDIRDYSDNYFTFVSPSTTCVEEDDGKNYYKKGNIASINGGTVDYCINSTTLREYYCSASGYIAWEDYVCPSGCYDGACIEK